MSAKPPTKRMASLIEKEEEWIHIFNTIGQDQPDRQDSASFGRSPLAAGEKNPVNPVYPVKKIEIEPNPHLINHVKFHTRKWIPTGKPLSAEGGLKYPSSPSASVFALRATPRQDAAVTQ
jgi:hypothetical protein